MTELLTIPVRTLRTVVAPLARVEIRDPSGTGDGSWTIGGYAAVFEAETVLFDAYGLRVKEELAAGAFGRVLERLGQGDGLVHLNHGHDMKSAIASTDVARSGPAGSLPIGGLELSSDEHGLRFFARVDAGDPDAIRLAAKMRRGVVNQASFAFTIEDERLLSDEDADDGYVELKYRVEEVRDLFDVCACAQGAYPQTESFLRSMTAASLRVPDLELPDRVGYSPAGRAGRVVDVVDDGLERDRTSDDPAGSGEDVDEGRAAAARKRLELKARIAEVHTSR